MDNETFEPYEDDLERVAYAQMFSEGWEFDSLQHFDDCEYFV